MGDGWGVCDGGCLHYGIDRVDGIGFFVVVRRCFCWPAVSLRVRCELYEGNEMTGARFGGY